MKYLYAIVLYRMGTKGYEDSRIALESWYGIAEKTERKNLSDIKVDFLSVDYVGNQHYVFKIRGNNYRLVVVVKFTISYIFIRWVGTHKDYDKNVVERNFWHTFFLYYHNDSQNLFSLTLLKD